MFIASLKWISSISFYDKYKKRHHIRTEYGGNINKSVGINGIYDAVCDCSWNSGDNDYIIFGLMITIFNLDNDGLDSCIYHSLNAVYYK